VTRLVAEFGTGQVLWSMIWFVLFFIWIWMLVVVFGDIFRSDDLGGWGKALWVIFIVVLPYLGVLVYLIARGSKMQARMMAAAQQQQAAQREYIQSVAGGGGGGSTADEIARLADLKAKGVLTEEEFQAGKAKALGG
jgi:type VI protein secretion system component VasK